MGRCMRVMVVFTKENGKVMPEMVKVSMSGEKVNGKETGMLTFCKCFVFKGKWEKLKGHKFCFKRTCFLNLTSFGTVDHISLQDPDL